MDAPNPADAYELWSFWVHPTTDLVDLLTLVLWLWDSGALNNSLNFTEQVRQDPWAAEAVTYMLAAGVIIPIVGLLFHHHGFSRRAYLMAEVAFDCAELALYAYLKKEVGNEKHLIVSALCLVTTVMDCLVLKGPEVFLKEYPVVAQVIPYNVLTDMTALREESRDSEQAAGWWSPTRRDSQQSVGWWSQQTAEGRGQRAEQSASWWWPFQTDEAQRTAEEASRLQRAESRGLQRVERPEAAGSGPLSTCLAGLPSWVKPEPLGAWLAGVASWLEQTVLFDALFDSFRKLHSKFSQAKWYEQAGYCIAAILMVLITVCLLFQPRVGLPSSAGEAEAYQCMSGFKDGWAKDKQVWCCQNHGMGCPPDNSVVPFAGVGKIASRLQGCDTACDVGGNLASCSARTTFAAQREFASAQDACDAAYNSVLGQCFFCSVCALADTGCLAR